MYSQPVIIDWATSFYCFPPNADGLLKISSHAIGYTNMLASLASDDETVSTPRTKHYGGTLAENAPQASLDELREQFRKCAWPDLADKPFEGSRLCWYSDTIDGGRGRCINWKSILTGCVLAEDWLIGYHKTYKSLFLATGGSGHAFKVRSSLRHGDCANTQTAAVRTCHG